jgi:hypothetical protein
MNDIINSIVMLFSQSLEMKLSYAYFFIIILCILIILMLCVGKSLQVEWLKDRLIESRSLFQASNERVDIALDRCRDYRHQTRYYIDQITAFVENYSIKTGLTFEQIENMYPELEIKKLIDYVKKNIPD